MGPTFVKIQEMDL